MRWLHFSDFHFKDTLGQQDVAAGALLSYLDSLPLPTIDAVFLVGDIAHSGQVSQYKRFEDTFLNPLRAKPALTSAKIFAVPGNHDVDCDAAEPITWDSIRTRNQAVYFNEDDVGRKTRLNRAKVFTHYWDFVARNNIYSPNPFNELTTLYGQDLGFPVDIIATNTSFFSDREEDSSAPITPCPLPSLRHHLNAIRRDRPMLLLGHHSCGCFRTPEQPHFTTLLIDKHLVYLHGHEHNPQLTANVDGTLRSIGFGAAYISPLEKASSPPYRNSFAICEIDHRLHLQGFSWDSEIGRWNDVTATQFYTGITEDTFDGTRINLRIPLLGDERNSPPRPVTSLRDAPRLSPRPISISLASLPSDRVWERLFTLSDSMPRYYRGSETIKPLPTGAHEGRGEFLIEGANTRDLLACIAAAGHILSAKEVESYNTRLDTEDFRSVTVLSFGKISGEARAMYLRLKTRKAIEILGNKDLTERSLQLISQEQANVLTQCDAASVVAEVLIDGDSIYVLLVHGGAVEHFSVVDEGGNALPATHSIVVDLRNHNIRFAKMAYEGDTSSLVSATVPPVFDEEEYLRRCYSENKAMAYAALANVGLRFSDLLFENVYIDASAAEVDDAEASRINSMLDDHLAVYPASENLKQQIKKQIARSESEDRQETSQAREFCQRYPSVLLTGDPGSGKTCFVKSELLAYSRRAFEKQGEQNDNTDEWHSVHVPVMVPLAQAAAEPDLQSEGLLKIASRLLSRKGFNLPAEVLESLSKQGRLALFFDGLDEVVSVEKRAIVVQGINELVATCITHGNRIVVTSRPAAVNLVNLLPSLRKLELRGLTEGEIRVLASRILQLKLADAGDDIVVDTTDPSTSDSAIIRQLIADCQQKPGVARLAQNPLLLTLLVMIYANSGAPSAKRHRIYEEAFKTLASVRGRQAGHEPLSAQDLRERLGAVALSVYRKESGLLPTRLEVAEIVRTVMSRQRGQDVPRAEADRFIQKVAESTGLIAIGGGSNKADDAAVITFMHHSFMEYFAAVGLSRELKSVDVVPLVTQPRWVEILTLLSGIIGESEDIAPVLVRFIDDGKRYGDVDARLLIFALDCALECEVPSEAAIRLLSTSIDACVRNGPARADAWVRSEIGLRLAQLIAACGFGTLETTLSALIRDNSPEVSAAAISLASYSCSVDSECSGIVAAIEHSCVRVEENVQAAICEVAARVKWLRTPLVLQVVGKCVKKTVRCKLAALEAIAVIPGLADKHWPDLINAMDDKELSVRRIAGRAAVQAGLDADLATYDQARRDLVANAFQHVYESSFEAEYPTGKVRKDSVSQLLRSPNLRDRLIGIQLLPAIVDGGEFAKSQLMELINDGKDREEVTAALRAMRSSRDAQVLTTAADFRRVVALAEQGTVDVRIAAIQLMGEFNSDSQAVRALLDRTTASLSPQEFHAVFFALSRSRALQQEVSSVVETELMARVQSKARRNTTFTQEVCVILECAERLGKNLSATASGAVQLIVKDFHFPDDIRKAALRAYPAIAVPSSTVVTYLTSLLKAPPQKMMGELVATLGIFAANCRQSVDHVIACVNDLSGLRDAAKEVHGQLLKASLSAETMVWISELRSGIEDVSQIIVTFEDFIDESNGEGPTDAI